MGKKIKLHELPDAKGVFALGDSGPPKRMFSVDEIMDILSRPFPSEKKNKEEKDKEKFRDNQHLA